MKKQIFMNLPSALVMQLILMRRAYFPPWVIREFCHHVGRGDPARSVMVVSAYDPLPLSTSSSLNTLHRN